jgi:predicted nicotinamide N-methyase
MIFSVRANAPDVPRPARRASHGAPFEEIPRLDYRCLRGRGDRAHARANGCHIAVVHHDVLDDDAPEVEVILAGDCRYEAAPLALVVGPLSTRVLMLVRVVLADASTADLALATSMGRRRIHGWVGIWSMSESEA